MAGLAGRSPEELALLETAMRVLPGGVLGGYYAPQELGLRRARGPGAAALRLLGPRVHRLHPGQRPPRAGPRPSRRDRRGRGPAPQGHDLLPAQRAHPGPGRGDLPRRALRRADPLLLARGSEATFFALRVARAFRQRDKILKFEGGFHGTHDYSLMSVGPRAPKAFPAPTPDSAGIPHAIQGEVLVAPFNDLAETEAMIDAHHDDLAAVIMEPLPAAGACRSPGFLQGVREITARLRRAADLRRDRHRLPLRLRRAPRSTTASCRTWPPSARSSAAASRSPRSRAARDIMRHLAPEHGGHGRASSSRRARSTATRSPPRRAWPPWPSCAGPAPTSASSRPARGSSRALEAAARRGRPARAGGGRGARVRDLLHRPADHRLPGHALRGPGAPRRLHARDARRAAWSRRPRSSTCRSSTPRRRWREPSRSSARRSPRWRELLTEHADYAVTGGFHHGRITTTMRRKTSGTAARSRAGAGSG